MEWRKLDPLLWAGLEKNTMIRFVSTIIGLASMLRACSRSQFGSSSRSIPEISYPWPWLTKDTDLLDPDFLKSMLLSGTGFDSGASLVVWDQDIDSDQQEVSVIIRTSRIGGSSSSYVLGRHIPWSDPDLLDNFRWILKVWFFLNDWKEDEYLYSHPHSSHYLEIFGGLGASVIDYNSNSVIVQFTAPVSIVSRLFSTQLSDRSITVELV